MHITILGDAEDKQVLSVDTTVFNPPQKLHVPDDVVVASSSDNSDSDISEESSSPKYASEPERPPGDPMENFSDSNSSENLFR